MKNAIVFLAGLFFIFLYSFSEFPFGSLFNSSLEFISIFRILFASLLLIRLFRSYLALPLLFSYEGFRTPSFFFLKGLYFLKIILCCNVIMGLFTDYSALLLFICYLVFFLKSRYYSIEDIYFQNTLFHLPFIAAGSFYSADSYLGFQSIFENSALFNSFFISNGLIMFSAGYEKFKSGLWLEGKGAYEFLSLPHLVKERFHFLHVNFRVPLIISGYVIMTAEFLLLPSACNNYLFLLVLLMLLAFSISLFVIVDISFIGQVVVLPLTLFLVILLNNWEHFNMKTPLTLIMPDLIDWIVVAINLITLLVIVFYKALQKFRIPYVQKFLTGVNSPIAVFNEKHLFGFYTYKLELVSNDKTRIQVISAFSEKGFPSKFQFFYPRYFQAAMYPVTDYCLGLIKYGKESKFKYSQVIDLMFCGLKSVKLEEGTIILSVKKFDQDDTIELYENQDWTELAECQFVDNQLNFQLLNYPPVLKKTFREV
jgi:hypothetical protein